MKHFLKFCVIELTRKKYILERQQDVELGKGEWFFYLKHEGTENTVAAAVTEIFGVACVLPLQSACSCWYYSAQKCNAGASGLSYMWKSSLLTF